MYKGIEALELMRSRGFYTALEGTQLNSIDFDWLDPELSHLYM
jgi:hypothetical protein